MKYLKQKTSGVFYYRRAVPTELRDIIGKKEYGFSLKTKDKHIALERYVAADKQAEALFNSYSVDAQKSEKDRVAALQAISQAFGQSYVSAASKSVNRRVKRVHVAA